MRLVEPIILLFLIVAIWELLTRAGVLPSRDLPPATAIGAALIRDAQHAELWQAVAATMGSWAVGFAASIIVGVPIGLFLGSSRIAYVITQPSLEFIRTIPSIAALPLLILIVGTGPSLATAMVLLGGLWPILIQTMYGARDVDPIAKETARAYGLSRGQLFTAIVLPSALPYIATGIRLAAVLGLILSVSASLIGGGDGLGFLILNASYSGVPALMFGRILLAGLLGLCVTRLLIWLDSRLLFWHVSERKQIT